MNVFHLTLFCRMKIHQHQFLVLFIIIVHLYSICFASKYCENYTECEGNDISHSDIHCQGAFSCHTAMKIESSSYVRCLGSKACAGVNNINITSGYWYCWGAESCYGSNGSTFGLSCLATKSCINSTITTGSTIEGDGSFSLSNAAITLSGNNKLSITLSGYQAGFGAIIDCSDNSVCTITCKSSGCLMVTLKGAGTWNIITNSDVADRPITNPELYDDTLLNIALLNDIIFDDNICNQQQQSQWLFDRHHERDFGDDIIYNDGNNRGPVCCRGYKACEGVTNILMQNSLNEAIVCSGAFSCHSVSVINNTNGSIACSGDHACADSAIFSNNAVHCTASYACWYANIMSGGNIYCSGYAACYAANISIAHNKNATIYFMGELSGKAVSLHCKKGASCFIFCGGSDSCRDIKSLRCDGECTVSCDIDTGCPALIQDCESSGVDIISLVMGCCVILIFLCLCRLYGQQSASSSFEKVKMTKDPHEEGDGPNETAGHLPQQQEDNDGNQHTVSAFDDHDDNKDEQNPSAPLLIENVDNIEIKEYEMNNKSKPKISDELPNNECIVCMDGLNHYACIPCGHLCLCEKCKDLVNETCPVCQSNCSDITKIYK